MMPEQSRPEGAGRKIVEYERLNGLGRAVFAAGAVAGLSAKLARRAVSRMHSLARETQRAFRAGLIDQEEKRDEPR